MVFKSNGLFQLDMDVRSAFLGTIFSADGGLAVFCGSDRVCMERSLRLGFSRLDKEFVQQYWWSFTFLSGDLGQGLRAIVDRYTRPCDRLAFGVRDEDGDMPAGENLWVYGLASTAKWLEDVRRGGRPEIAVDAGDPVVVAETEVTLVVFEDAVHQGGIKAAEVVDRLFHTFKNAIFECCFFDDDSTSFGEGALIYGSVLPQTVDLSIEARDVCVFEYYFAEPWKADELATEALGWRFVLGSDGTVVDSQSAAELRGVGH